MQVKRIHEYKRQLLNILGIIYRYDRIKNMSPEERKQVFLYVTLHTQIFLVVPFYIFMQMPRSAQASAEDAYFILFIILLL